MSDRNLFDHLYSRFYGVTWCVQMILNRIWSSGGGPLSTEQVDATVDMFYGLFSGYIFPVSEGKVPPHAQNLHNNASL